MFTQHSLPKKDEKIQRVRSIRIRTPSGSSSVLCAPEPAPRAREPPARSFSGSSRAQCAALFPVLLPQLNVQLLPLFITMSSPAKLFLGQIPKHMNEDELTPLFQPYGNIVELAVIRDKASGTHRGTWTWGGEERMEIPWGCIHRRLNTDIQVVPF